MLNLRFDMLQPLFKARGFNVYNCYKESGLKTFPFLPFKDALAMAKTIPDPDPTAGLYDRKAKEKETKKSRGPIRTIKEFRKCLGV